MLTHESGGAPPEPDTFRRLLRFALTGGTAGATQIALLALLLHLGRQAVVANMLAFLLAAQLNFALSTLFTWRDRQVTRTPVRQWLVFHGSIAGMALLNMAVFLAAHRVVPALAASALGIAAAASGNFLLGDRLVFRPGLEHALRTSEKSAA